MRRGLTVEGIRAYHREEYKKWKYRQEAKVLTNRQRMIFRLLGEGHSRESAAANLGTTYGTIKNHIVRARLKTAMTTEQLVAKVAVDDYKRGLMNSAPLGVPRN